MVKHHFSASGENTESIEKLVCALAECEDESELTNASVSHQLLDSPVTAALLTNYVEIGYCDKKLVDKKCSRLLELTGGNWFSKSLTKYKHPIEGHYLDIMSQVYSTGVEYSFPYMGLACIPHCYDSG
jgi:hypothetical protein